MKKIIRFLILAAGICKTSESGAQINVQDSLALVDLYNSTNGAVWTHNTNWLTTSQVSTWYGVTVGGGRVTELSLTFNQLSGSIPSSIGVLVNLQYLYLSNNHLSGSIPSTIGNMTNLQYLQLNFNQLSGSIPSTIGNLTNLLDLELQGTQLSGSIPSSIGGLVNLQYLILSNNQLSGSIPSTIGNMTNLQVLQLTYNQLSGSIPSTIGNLTNLLDLELQENQLSGSIPATIGNMASLTYLAFDYNQLSGSIPSTIGNMTNLTGLHLDNNQLSDSIPSSICNLTNLTDLELQENQLTGSIPSAISNLVKLMFLYLNNNQLSGSIPSIIGNSTSLGDVKLYENQFTFAGMEELVEEFEGFRTTLIYDPQADITITNTSGILSVSAGGTLSKNTYNWYEDGTLVATKVGDSTYTVIGSDANNYSVAVTNSIATALTLYSDTVTAPQVTYCASSGTSTAEYIETVKLGTINHTTTNDGGYGNFTSVNTNLTAGTPYKITLTRAFTSTTFKEGWTVYIDYNHDGSFTGTGETVAAGTEAKTHTNKNYTFTIPTTAPNGATRMRIQLQRKAASTNPCATITDGDVQDFTVTITGGVPPVEQNEPIEFTKANILNSSTLSIIPNPIAGASNATAVYNLAKEGNTTLQVIDLTGRMVYSQNLGIQNVGQHNYLLYNMASKLHAGYYVVVLEQNNQVVARNRFIVTK